MHWADANSAEFDSLLASARTHYRAEVREEQQAATRFEVQHATLCQGWLNTWQLDDKPMTFATHAEAKAELDDLLADIADEIAAGRRAPDAGYDDSEFRIVAVADPPEA